MTNIEKIVTKIPNLSKVVLKLENLKKIDSFELVELIEVLQENQLAVSKIMKMANSKFFGFSNSIDSLHNAVSLYGFNFTISVAISEIINNTLIPNLDMYHSNKNDFFSLNEQSLKLMFLWLKKEELSLKEELIIPCLINKLGMFLTIDLIKPENQKVFIDEIKKNPLDISSIEKKIIGYTSFEITSIILEKWNFDIKTINIIKNIDNIDSKQSAILNVLSKIFNPLTPFTKESIMEGLKLADYYDLDVSSLKESIEEFFILLKNK